MSATTPPPAPGMFDPNAGKLTRQSISVNIGPQHPAMHGTLRQLVELDGEIVAAIESEIGFLHTGFEKLAEHMTYNQFITVTDRMNYFSALNNNIGFALAVEETLGIEVSERCKVLRVLLSEISRFSDHIVCVGLGAMDVGAFSVMLWSWIEREECYNLFEITTGTRLTTGFTRIGGMLWDVPLEFEERVRDLIPRMKKILLEVEYMLDKNRIFLDRTRGVGKLPADILVDYGTTGPMLRAAGVPYDVRKAMPYLGYETYEFDIPTQTTGCTFARYRQRIDEMRETIRIIEQAVERLAAYPPPPVPDGMTPEQARRLRPPDIENEKFRLPPKNSGNRPQTMEAVIMHFKQIMDHHGYETPVGKEFYSATESPNGELGWSIVTRGDGTPYKIRCRTPSLHNYQCFPEMVTGIYLSDVVAVLAGFNVIAGELDR